MAGKKSWWQRHAPWSFLSTSEEWHACVIGWAETACPWWARYKVTKKAEYGVWHEAHYYLFGRVIGMVTCITILLVTAKLIQIWLF